MPTRYALYKIDDSADPGYAIVQLNHVTFEKLDYRLWNVTIIKIVRPSQFIFWPVGHTFDVVEGLLSFD